MLRPSNLISLGDGIPQRSSRVAWAGDAIDVGGVGIDIATSGEFALGPVGEEWHAVAAVVLATFLAAHAGVKDLGSGGGAVVGGENEDGVIAEFFFVEELAQFADVVIDVRDHAVEVGAPE